MGPEAISPTSLGAFDRANRWGDNAQPVQPVPTILLGQVVVLLSWDATDDTGHGVSSGICCYRLQAGESFQAVKKMLLLR